MVARTAQGRQGATSLSVRVLPTLILVSAFLCSSAIIWRVGAASDFQLVGAFAMQIEDDNEERANVPTKELVKHDEPETTALKEAKNLADDKQRRHTKVAPNAAAVSTPQNAEGDPRMTLLPDHCSAAKRGEIVLKGERHSGTNFIERILRQNTWRDMSEVGESKKYGWKHGFLPPLGGYGQPFDTTEDVLVVITRDAFVWLSKMMAEAYDPIMNAKRKGGFSSFIRAAYSNICHDDNNENATEVPCESAANLVQARTHKYKQWLSDDPDSATYSGSKESFLQSRIHVRLESVVATADDAASMKKHQTKYIRDPLRERCVFVTGDMIFRAVTFHTTNSEYNNRLHRTIDPDQEKKEMLKKYSKEDLRFVLSQLDLAFERQIGYDYGYVYDILNE